MRHPWLYALLLLTLAHAGCAGDGKTRDRRDDGGAGPPPPRVSSGAAPSRPTSVTGTEWYLLRLGNDAAITQEPHFRPRFLLDPSNERRVTGSTGVNTLNGTYELSGGALQFGPIAITRRAGRPETMALEAAFLDALKRTATAETRGNTLTLRDAARQPLAEFQPLDAMR